jgi:peptide/nickel transport system permease protein
MLPVLLGVSLLVFTMMYFSPGDPARIILGEMATDADVIALRHDMGLDKSFLEQYFNYVGKAAFRMDLGTSYLTRRPVATEIWARFPTTMLLTILSVTLSVLLGIPAGIVSATHQYSIFDNLVMAFALVGVSMPNFWQGLVLILIFSVSLGWLPSSGFYGPLYWILPAITIGTSSMAIITRMTRSSMLEVINQDYIRTARAKGQSERLIIWKHALKNALIPIVTVVGLQLGRGLGGAILTESIFSIPGLGKLMVDSIKARNYPVVQGGVLFIAVMFSLINLGVDILYAFIDPRIKSQYRLRRRRNTQEAVE